MKNDDENTQIGSDCQKRLVRLELVSGMEGKCLVMNDTRIAGPKPSGGGIVQKTWDIPAHNITEALYQDVQVMHFQSTPDEILKYLQAGIPAKTLRDVYERLQADLDPTLIHSPNTESIHPEPKP